MPVKPKGNFGVDAPFAPWMWIGFAIVYAVLAYASKAFWSAPVWVTILLIIGTLGFLLGAGVFWYATFRGKFVVWDRILSELPAEDIHRVLDLGCGHGAVAIQTANRFPDATVDGIDLWRSVDQSGNTIDAARHNLQLNGVDGRVTLATGDMVDLPYPDATFDLVTASMAIHNIPHAVGRAQAVREAWRVLAPQGHLVIVDIQRTAEYASILRELGADQVTLRGIGWRMWWSGPWMSTSLLQVRKGA